MMFQLVGQPLCICVCFPHRAVQKRWRMLSRIAIKEGVRVAKEFGKKTLNEAGAIDLAGGCVDMESLTKPDEASLTRTAALFNH